MTVEGNVSIETFMKYVIEIFQCYEFCIDPSNKIVTINIEDYKTHNYAVLHVDLSYIYAWLSDLDEYEFNSPDDFDNLFE